MEIINGTNPYDIIYPLNKDKFEDSRIVYHGTSSNYSKLIESQGWNVNAQIYDISDMKQVCDTFDLIRYSDSKGYVNLRSYSIGVTNHHIGSKLPSFTHDYWIARNYARNPGGETIKALMSAVEDFDSFSNSEELIINHLSKVQKELDKYKRLLLKIENLDPPKTKKDRENRKSIENNYDKYYNAISILQNRELLKKSVKQLEKLKKKYRRFFNNHYGVVYVIKVEPAWFINWREPFTEISDNNGKVSKLRTPAVDLAAIKPIPAENIIARVNFPNQIFYFRPDSSGPFPVSWNIFEFKKWLLDHKWSVDDGFLTSF